MKSLLTNIAQLSNLMDAFERVRENKGCAGSDGVGLSDFEKHLKANLQGLSYDLENKLYHPFPLLRFPVPKSKAKGVRYLSVPTIRDRVAQAAVFLKTRIIFEKEFENISHAYRLGRGVKTAIEEIEYWREQGYIYAVDADIDAYFDSVPHDLLMGKLEKLIPDEDLLRLFEKWIKAEVYDGKKIWTLEKGIPQGSVVSPMMANLFLDELDETLLAFDKKLVRYADDFLILSKTEKEAEENIELTDMILDDLKLDLNPLKTKIVSFDQGFKFLGAVFLRDDVYLPEPKKRVKRDGVHFPPALTLKRYLELRNKD
ncbi:RNA-directed DNA polymerase [candidate division KSB1 bacterium]|nr:RNA-directed DNA polymerase [candidate division KSB1 bacterium]